MSQIVDQFLLEQMKKEDDDALMYNEDGVGEMLIDHLCGYDEDSNSYDPDQGLLFPQPIKKI